jgi:hypothetical protein
VNPGFAQGVYEGATAFDDVYTRIVDAMIEVDPLSYIADPASTLHRCLLQAHAALAILQQRAFEVVEAMDFQQAVTDRIGQREIAWFYDRDDLVPGSSGAGTYFLGCSPAA